MNILIYNSGGGLGDSIQLMDLITSLQRKFNKSKLYYLSAHANHFDYKLKDFNIKLETIDLGLKYFGFRIRHFFLAKNRFKNKGFDKIDLIIDLQSKMRNTLILSRIPSKFFYSPTFGFKFCSKKKEYLDTKYDINIILKNIEKLLDIEIPIEKYEIKNINDKFFNEAKKLLPKDNYIGFSVTQGNVYRKKQWSINNFINVANKITKKGKIPVFFIEKSQVELINQIKDKVEGAIFPELSSQLSSPALVTALSTRLEKAISIDNGIMHMMALANIPMIVLFGPTNSKKFAPKIKNIQILDSKILRNSDDINTIQVEDLLNLI